MDKDKKRIIAGSAVLGGAGLAALLLRRRQEEAPPGEGYGKIWGYIKNSETEGRISGARVYMDDNLEFTSGIKGEYSTGYYLFGEHCLVVEADNYETLTTTIVIVEESAKTEIRLNPLTEAPTQWTEGVVVREIRVEPTLAYVGETIEIKVYVEYPWPEFEGMHIDGEIIVNGQILQGSMDAPETIMRFQYPATVPGSYEIRAQDKSAHFQVEQSEQGTFYSPWGNERYPICTEMIIPDVNPFTLTYGNRTVYDHPGGDLKLPPWGENRFSLAVQGEYPGDYLCRTPSILKEIGSWDQVALAYPSKWDPAEAVVHEYEKELKAWGFQVKCYYFKIKATDYDCPPYWYSQEELAEFLAEHGPYVTTCGAGMCTPKTLCPYGDHWITGVPHTQGLGWDKLSFMRLVLSHIIKVHPDHPLTEPPPGF